MFILCLQYNVQHLKAGLVSGFKISAQTQTLKNISDYSFSDQIQLTAF